MADLPIEVTITRDDWDHEEMTAWIRNAGGCLVHSDDVLRATDVVVRMDTSFPEGRVRVTFGFYDAGLAALFKVAWTPA